MKAITQYIYDLIFLVFISRKLQLSSVVILFLSPVANELQSPGVSPCIVSQNLINDTKFYYKARSGIRSHLRFP